MNRDISNFRKSYSKNILDERFISDSPIILFDEWFNDADLLKNDSEINAMTLSTIDKNGNVIWDIEYDEQPYKINPKQKEITDCISNNYQAQNYTFSYTKLQQDVDLENYDSLYKVFRYKQDLYKKLFTSLGNGKWKMNIK